MDMKHRGYMTTRKERISYWTYFVGQNIYYNITAAFISTYLAMQGIDLAKVAAVLLMELSFREGKAEKEAEKEKLKEEIHALMKELEEN